MVMVVAVYGSVCSGGASGQSSVLIQQETRTVCVLICVEEDVCAIIFIVTAYISCCELESFFNVFRGGRVVVWRGRGVYCGAGRM